MKTHNKDFDLFKKQFKKWQKKFGLDGFRVHFQYEPLEGKFATIQTQKDAMVATVGLNSALPSNHKPHKDIRRDAKHEALHLLLTRLADGGKDRFSSETELYEAEEELVNKLSSLIPD